MPRHPPWLPPAAISTAKTGIAKCKKGAIHFGSGRAALARIARHVRTINNESRPPTEAAYLRWQIGSMLSVVQCQAGPKPQLNRRLLVTGKRGIRNGIDSMASTKTARKMIAPLSPFLPGRRSLMTGKLGQRNY